MNDKKNILIIKPDGIGDFIIFTSALPYIKKKYAGAKITLLVQSSVSGLAASLDEVDHVIEIDKQLFFKDEDYRSVLIDNLANSKYSLAIYPAFSRDILGDFIALNINAKETVSFVGDDSNTDDAILSVNNLSYSRQVDIDNTVNSELDRLRIFTESLCGVSISSKDFYPQISVDCELLRSVAEKILSDGINDQYIVIAPFAGSNIREWSIDKWIAFVDSYPKQVFVICGTEKDKRKATEILERCCHRNVHECCGKFTLVETAALIKNAKVLIGVESGPCHMAAAVSTPSVVITGGGHFGRFVPWSDLQNIVNKKMDCYGCNWHCKYKRPYCIDEIRVENVINAADKSGLISAKVRKNFDGSGQFYAFASWNKAIGNLEEAEKWFSKVIALNSDKKMVGGSFFHLGEMFMQKDDLAEAFRCFRKCLKLIPDHKKAKKFLQ